MYTIPTRTNHPALAGLESAIATAEKAHKDAEAAWQSLSRLLPQVDPSSWTQRIERALGKPDEMASLRIQRDETLITFASANLSYHLAVKAVFDARLLLADAIAKAAEFADCLEHYSPDIWLKPIIASNCIMANELRLKDIPGSYNTVSAYRVGTNTPANKEIYDALKRAFANLSEALSKHPKCWVSLSFVKHSLEVLYPAVPVRPISSVKHHYVDQRDVRPMDFVDCIGSEHPACRKLAELLPVLATAFDQDLRQQSTTFRCHEKGRVNEQQYSERLLAALVGHHSDTYTNGMVSAQHQLRLKYESARLALLASIISVEDLRRQVKEVLLEAMSETKALEDEMNQDGCRLTVDKLLTHHLALINCLAADSMLRYVGSVLSEFHEEVVQDISKGHGSRAIAEEYSKLDTKSLSRKAEREDS